MVFYKVTARLLAFSLLVGAGALACNPTPTAPPNVHSCESGSDCLEGEECLNSVCIKKGTTVIGEGGAHTEVTIQEINSDGVNNNEMIPDGTTPDEINPNEANPDGVSPKDAQGSDSPPELPPSACLDGETQSCFTSDDKFRSVGACKDGQQTCANGLWEKCSGQVVPTKELCDGVDNDCDGEIDETFTELGKPCSVGKGSCVSVGVFLCEKSGTKVICDAKKTPGKPEICDGKDNDCDGKIDDLPPGKACKVQGQSGPCEAGLDTCVNGQMVCISNQKPTSELCDGIDNDCNGQIDETFPSKNQACLAGKGECQNTGIWVCKSGGVGVECNAKPKTPKTEICDGKDNDCDGQTDETCNCQNGHKQACYSGSQGCSKSLPGNSVFTCKGTCKAGSQECKNGVWGKCEQEIVPIPELCDGKDNDCDGKTDNGNPGGGTKCQVPNAKGDCASGQLSCSNGKPKCISIKQPSVEVCDGKDNDCDGVVDDNVSFGGVTICAVSGAKGECAKGKHDCKNGQVICEQTHKSIPELCDGLDNDCDGQIDNGNPGNGGACAVSGKQGVCAEGKQTCFQGKLLCQQVVQPSAETCDGKDNNCDGQTDNGMACKKGETRCGGVTRESIYACKSDCSGFSYKKTCNVLNREFCDGGQCKKCPCTRNTKKCDGKDLMVCTFQSGVCGWYVQKKCRKGCRSGILGSRCK